jgi:hypothetical protein
MKPGTLNIQHLTLNIEGNLRKSRWSAGSLPASWLKHQEIRRLEAGAPSAAGILKRSLKVLSVGRSAFFKSDQFSFRK